MRDPFARATKSILGKLGKDAFLRGAPAGKVNIEHGVEVYERNGDGEAVFARSVATIGKEFAPKQGDTLVMLNESGVPTVPTYELGRLHADSGYTARYILIANP